MPLDLEYTNDENLERIADALVVIANMLSAPGDIDDRPVLQRMVVALDDLVIKP